jgi:hypothetical protein
VGVCVRVGLTVAALVSLLVKQKASDSATHYVGPFLIHYVTCSGWQLVGGDSDLFPNPV